MANEQVKPVAVAVWLGLLLALVLAVVIPLVTVEHIDLLWVAGPRNVKLYHHGNRWLLGECEREARMGHDSNICMVEGKMEFLEMDSDDDGLTDVVVRGPVLTGGAPDCLSRGDAGTMEHVELSICSAKMGFTVW